MQKRVVIKNGKKYIVNAPGWEDGVGPGAPQGVLWMLSTDGNWYEVNLEGSSGSLVFGSASLSVNQTPLTWASNDVGYQLLLCPDDNNVYQAYLSGSAGNVTMSIGQVPSGSAMAGGNYKPYLFMQSTTDGHFYPVYARSGSVYYFVDQNAKQWMGQPALAPTFVDPKGSIAFTSASAHLVITASNDWAMGTGDFTAEWFQYQTADGQAPNYQWPRIFEVGAYNDPANIKFGVTNESSTLYVWLAGGFVYANAISNFLNRWCHFAVCRSGSNLIVYKDGTKLGSTVTSTHNITSDTRNMYIGAESGSSVFGTFTGTTFPGMITNLHIVKGQCLYTGSTLTVPTTPIRPTENTKLLLLAGAAGSYLVRDSSGTNKVVTNRFNSASWSGSSPF